MSPALQAVLIALTVSAGIYDCRERRIPNWITLCGLILGLGINWLLLGWNGCFSSLLGMAAALAIYIPLYCLRGMGAGDVKLMAAVGAVAGPRDWLTIFLLTALTGGLISLAVVVYKKRVFHTFLNVSVITSELLHGRQPLHAGPELDVRNKAALRLPHALPIALASSLFLAFFLTFSSPLRP